MLVDFLLQFQSWGMNMKQPEGIIKAIPDPNPQVKYFLEAVIVSYSFFVQNFINPVRKKLAPMGDEAFLLHARTKHLSWAHTWDDTWIRKVLVILVSRFSSTHTYKMIIRSKHDYTWLSCLKSPQQTHAELHQLPYPSPHNPTTWITRVCPLHCSWSARQSSKSVRCKGVEMQSFSGWVHGCEFGAEKAPQPEMYVSICINIYIYI